MCKEIKTFDEFSETQGKVEDFKRRVLAVFDSLSNVCKYNASEISIKEDRGYIDLVVRYNTGNFGISTLKKSIVETALSGDMEGARRMLNDGDAYGVKV